MSILKLLEEPFGPYEDFRILDPAWPRYHTYKHRPKLTSVHMKCGGTDIGLDETEFLQEAPPTSKIVVNQVKVIGVLEIERLDWLSKTGREWLESDLRRRDDEKSTATKPSQLTLEAIYGDGVNSGSKISVWLKFDKVLSAAYMTLDDDPTSLVLHAKDQNRLFCVETLDVLAYELSRNFFERYRIRRLIKELVDGSDTPIQGRNIDWLVKQYLAQVVPMDSFSRIIYRPDISSAVHNKRGDMVLKKPRHRRTIHKAAVREIFARQAEWILADQIGSSSYNARILDIPSWVEFVKQVRAARRSARAQGMRWGEPWNQTADMTASNDMVNGIDLAQFGGTPEKWNQFLRNALANPLHWQEKLIQKSVPPRGPPIQSPSATLTSKKPPLQPPQKVQPEPSKPRNLRTAPIEYQYDSDFSEASTAAATDSEDSDSADSQKAQQLDVKVPWYCTQPPTLKCTQHVWKCPDCDDYVIDLLQPDEDELEEIPEHYAELLRLKRWTRVTEPDVMDAFACLVNNHFTGHLRALGLQAVADNKVSVRKWPEERKRKSRRLNRNSAPNSQRR